MNIRSLTEADRDAWEHLYRGYAAYYKVETSSTKLDTLFSWLCDPEHVCEGLVADVSGQLVGLAHFRAMPSPLRGANVGFLDDLFVDPKHRGQRVGEKILNKLKEISKSKGWNLIRWITHDDNVRAKSLYDRVAEKTSWELYELK